MALRRNRPDQPRPARKDARGMDPIKAAILMMIAVALAFWFGFNKRLPFTHGFELNAVVTDAVAIRPNSPVRISGVTIGTVRKVEPYGDGDGDGHASKIVMELHDDALPIHKDATLKIRPRIFLEGNWFVDLRPGSPGSPSLSSGDSLPVTQTAVPVQFDQILTILQSSSREDLKNLLTGFGTALMHEPTAAEDADQDAMVRGKTAAQALNRSLDDAAPALRDAATVNEAMLGQNTHDLSDLIASIEVVTGALTRNEKALQGFVTNLNVATGAFASERDKLRRSVELLAPTVRHARVASDALSDALPNVRALALELVEPVKDLPNVIAAAEPWIDQARPLVGEKELGGVVAQLSPTARSLAGLWNESISLMPQTDLTAQCITNWVLPVGDIKVDDGPFSTGVENYKEFWYTLVGFNGEGQNFDGGGRYVRFQLGGGSYAWATGPYGPSGGEDVAFQQWSRTNKPPLGTRPAYPGKAPPYVYDKNCKDQKLPDVNGKPAGPADGSGPGGVPAAPYVPTGSQASATQSVSAAGRKGVGGDLAAELVSTLNPFTGGEGARR